MSDKPTHSLYRGVIYITSAVTRAFQRCIIQYILLLNYIIYGRGGVLLLLWPIDCQNCTVYSGRKAYY
jgi:hypothetical protein